MTGKTKSFLVFMLGFFHVFSQFVKYLLSQYIHTNMCFRKRSAVCMMRQDDYNVERRSWKFVKDSSTQRGHSAKPTHHPCFVNLSHLFYSTCKLCVFC